MYLFFFLSMSDLLCFIISNTDKHEFSSIWKWISCYNDVINPVDCIIKRDVYSQKMHPCSKNICGISFFVKKYPWFIKKKIYDGCLCMDIPLVKR